MASTGRIIIKQLWSDLLAEKAIETILLNRE